MTNSPHIPGIGFQRRFCACRQKQQALWNKLRRQRGQAKHLCSARQEEDPGSAEGDAEVQVDSTEEKVCM